MKNRTKGKGKAYGIAIISAAILLLLGIAGLITKSGGGDSVKNDPGKPVEEIELDTKEVVF